MSPSRTAANDSSPASTSPASTGAAESFNQICTARIELLHTKPPIWREVDLPTSITLKVLHHIVQITMGWLDLHLWEFRTGGRTYGLPMDEDWGTAPRTEASKVRLRDPLAAVENWKLGRWIGSAEEPLSGPGSLPQVVDQRGIRLGTPSRSEVPSGAGPHTREPLDPHNPDQRRLLASTEDDQVRHRSA